MCLGGFDEQRPDHGADSVDDTDRDVRAVQRLGRGVARAAG